MKSIACFYCLALWPNNKDKSENSISKSTHYMTPSIKLTSIYEYRKSFNTTEKVKYGQNCYLTACIYSIFVHSPILFTELC